MVSGGRQNSDDGPVDTRISLAKMRELLPADEKYTDEYLIQLRKELYDLAELALDCYFEEKRRKARQQGDGANAHTPDTGHSVSDQTDGRA